MKPIRVCIADPPYIGCAHHYSKPGTPEYHPDAMRWDDPEEHVRLMADMDREFQDGWALATSTDPGLRLGGEQRALHGPVPPAHRGRAVVVPRPEAAP